MRKYDFDPELEGLLKSLKDHPALGGDFDFQKSWIDIANKCGFPKDTSNMTHTWRDWLEFYIWDFTHVLLKPVGAVAFSVVLFVGGWIGVANASLGSLPGSQLYSVKLGMERVQMALTSSSAQKAQLRTEFTSRRLDEMVALAALSSASNNVQLAIAVDRVKQDVEEIKSDLSQESNNEATELARAVGRKADVYASTVSASTPSLSKEVQEKVKQVQSVISETKDQAVDVMITSHEKTVTAENTHELELTFQKTLARVSLVATTKEEQKKLQSATELQKKGMYRRAFQVLKEIEVAHAVTPSP